MIKRVLVVCAGNVCRSPMAAALLERRLSDVTVESAGITALVGHSADPMAVSLMRESGLDIRSHRARQLLFWMTEASDLVLVMDRFQKQFLERRFALSRGRVYLLGEFVTTSGGSKSGCDIPDPYRRDRASFEESLRLIEAGVDVWSARIASLSDGSAAPESDAGQSAS
ncbi:low molecular weight phosphotyrosine protein phosphatase [Paraburkholderia nemoris]|uniref:low molecular weight protein-tyrosine-phosphatase n=1 Tax=Paraburkholderia nemoris TaxID=2793076 RepID=UPI0038BA8671